MFLKEVKMDIQNYISIRSVFVTLGQKKSVRLHSFLLQQIEMFLTRLSSRCCISILLLLYQVYFIIYILLHTLSYY